MSHGDHVDVPPPGIASPRRARTARSPPSSTRRKPLFGVQFHPEVAHTPRGGEIAQQLPVRYLRLHAGLDAGPLHRDGGRADPAAGRRRRSA